MFSEGIAGFLTFTLPIVLVVMFFLCFFRFLFRCCSRMPEPLAPDHRCPHHCEAGRRCGETGEEEGDSPRHMLPRHLRHSEFDLNFPYGAAMPMSISELFNTPHHVPPHMSESFPPKYEDAIKMPAATPRRHSTVSHVPPPPVYEPSTSTGLAEPQAVEQPPAYGSISMISTGRIGTPLPTTSHMLHHIRISSGSASRRPVSRAAVSGYLESPSLPGSCTDLASTASAIELERPSTSASLTPPTMHELADEEEKSAASSHPRLTLTLSDSAQIGSRPRTNAAMRSPNLFKASIVKRPKTAVTTITVEDEMPWHAVPGVVPDEDEADNEARNGDESEEKVPPAKKHSRSSQ
ncbi:hypothetical protein AAVH_10872 [Aphelenchoides avenae]|nr:hypothetical protein AAVH_10872 [Aphelenchus avenae]